MSDEKKLQDEELDKVSGGVSSATNPVIVPGGPHSSSGRGIEPGEEHRGGDGGGGITGGKGHPIE
ncbi:MAG: hypothetical protein JO104_07915 [Candidatus Eremiobacteraeota bacterium]|nr:hypothetical protein [Candidatus Eremiobacteraeota bacterium]